MCTECEKKDKIIAVQAAEIDRLRALRTVERERISEAVRSRFPIENRNTAGEIVATAVRADRPTVNSLGGKWSTCVGLDWADPQRRSVSIELAPGFAPNEELDAG